MECHKKNSSHDTIPSLDCEEIGSVTPQLNSSLETVALLQESKHERRRRKPLYRGQHDKTKKHCKHHRKRCEHRKQYSHHRNELETITKQTILQAINVKKDNFKFIINLNTTVYDHKNSPKIFDVEKSQSYKKKDRPVPQCQKPLCCPTRHVTKLHGHSKETCKADLYQRTKDSEQTAIVDKTRHRLYKWRHKKRYFMKPSPEKASRIETKKQFLQHTSTRLEQYDQISNKSLKNYLDIPMSYKTVIKYRKKHESKLDTLIKRTKERERKLVEQSRNNNIASSTPYTDISSGDFSIISKYTASLHSRSTLVLDPLQPCEQGYFPSIESFYPVKAEKYYKYSPTSFNEYNSEFKLNIKSESTIDSGPYSLIQHPLQKLFNNQEWIKKDIKSEPKEEKFSIKFD